MTRKTALEKQIEDLGSRPSSQATLSGLLLLECLEGMQAEKTAKRKRRPPKGTARKSQDDAAKQSD